MVLGLDRFYFVYNICYCYFFGGFGRVNGFCMF